MTSYFIPESIMRVDVDIAHTDVDGDQGQVDGLALICGRCGHEVKVFGTTGASARYGALKLNEECPQDENNFYDVNWD